MPRVNVLRNLKIREVSSVDRGAGKGVRVMLMKRNVDAYLKRNVVAEAEAVAKREFSADERRAAARTGHAMKDGSFPINSVQDLKNAIQAIGRAKDPAAAKSHVRRQAARLGQTDLLPSSWSVKKTRKQLLDLAGSAGEIYGITKGAISFAAVLAEMSSMAYPMGVVQAVKTAGHALKDSIRSINDSEELNSNEKAAAVRSSFSQFMDHLASVAPGGIVKSAKMGVSQMAKLEKQLAKVLAAKAHTSVGQGTDITPPAKDPDVKVGPASDPAAGTGNDSSGPLEGRNRRKKMRKALKAATAAAVTWETRFKSLVSLDKASKDFLNHEDNDMDEEEKCKFLDLPPAKRVKFMEERPLTRMTEKRIASLPEDVRKQLTEGKLAVENVNKLLDERELNAFAKRAVDLGQPTEFGKSLRVLAKGIGTEEEREKALEEVEKLLKGYAEQARQGGVFKEFGSTRNQAAEGSAEAQLYAKRDELLAEVTKSNGAKLTPEQAFARVYEASENRELVAQYKRESQRRAA